jgi:anti-sigma regulatory factor (Ser/Thr protein kinase)
VPCLIVTPFSFPVRDGTSLALCVGESQETEWRLFELEDTLTSNAVPQNEPDRSFRVGDHRLQKVSVFLNWAVPSDPKFLNDAVVEITRAIGDTPLWGDVEGIGLAVREALANAILHGNHADPERTVDVSVAVNESCDLIITIRDSGPGFDPNHVPDPTVGDSLLTNHGRGIFLIRQFMDQVDFRFKQGTEVVMQRRRQWRQ